MLDADLEHQALEEEEDDGEVIDLMARAVRE